jgi:hypothetical protein
MFAMILEVAPKTKKPDFDKWADDIRKMVELDKHTPEEIAKVFEWTNRDNFWRTNILSPSKLRQKFSQLHAKMGNQHEINKPNFNNRTETKLERISRQADEIFADATNH